MKNTVTQRNFTANLLYKCQKIIHHVQSSADNCDLLHANNYLGFLGESFSNRPGGAGGGGGGL